MLHASIPCSTVTDKVAKAMTIANTLVALPR
jgi:hypothetical protein